MPLARDDSPPGPQIRVALTSDQRLVAEAVVAALASRELDATVVAWPLGARDETVAHRLEALEPAVAVLLYDVDLSLRMARASAVLRSWPGPWLVLTAARPGPAWGGLLSAGAAAVLSDHAGLERVEDHVRALASGVVPGDPEARAEHVGAWRDFQAAHGELQERIDLLAPRERDVLELLRRGVRVVDIARQWGLAEATVRTQVRAVLRKLGVRSQLAAVALLRATDDDGPPA